ncbi:Na(+)-translocating NADH-quinone reductase subunit C [Thiorhodovibrio winogradskyi]|uniref:Na(+)-translocating NADH-quinone reductase subunit C n=1 Tax=Thiorhodovibrio winogradskyi TaxID=77007 RepID=A0ABZ0SFQ2_9GAMM|nr:Na(+)-translocating NADH-quinone reductase subunit C [Thiorhodovibrio winogradskyi]
MPAEALLSRLRSGLRSGLGAIFARPNDDPIKTVAVALVLCLACSVVVSATAVGLRPLQERNASLALKREILRVAGIEAAGAEIERAFAAIEVRLVDLASGDYVAHPDPMSYSYRDAANDPLASLALGEEDIAGIRRRPDKMPVYLVREDSTDAAGQSDAAGQIETVILPVYGYGLWSTMHGLVALHPDGRRAKALTFYEQRETAGLGGEVANPGWQAKWEDKTLIGPEGEPVIRVAKGPVDPTAADAHKRVDGLSGATLTTNGVTYLMQFWLGEQGFGPYLEKLRADNSAANNSASVSENSEG